MCHVDRRLDVSCAGNAMCNRQVQCEFVSLLETSCGMGWLDLHPCLLVPSPSCPYLAWGMRLCCGGGDALRVCISCSKAYMHPSLPSVCVYMWMLAARHHCVAWGCYNQHNAGRVPVLRVYGRVAVANLSLQRIRDSVAEFRATSGSTSQSMLSSQRQRW